MYMQQLCYHCVILLPISYRFSGTARPTTTTSRINTQTKRYEKKKRWWVGGRLLAAFGCRITCGTAKITRRSQVICIFCFGHTLCALSFACFVLFGSSAIAFASTAASASAAGCCLCTRLCSACFVLPFGTALVTYYAAGFVCFSSKCGSVFFCVTFFTIFTAFRRLNYEKFTPRIKHVSTFHLYFTLFYVTWPAFPVLPPLPRLRCFGFCAIQSCVFLFSG